MVLGKLPVPGRPAGLEKGRAGAYCVCSLCGRGWFGHFFSSQSFLSSFSLSLGDGLIWTEILSQKAVKPKTINQPISEWPKLHRVLAVLSATGLMFVQATYMYMLIM